MARSLLIFLIILSCGKSKQIDPDPFVVGDINVFEDRLLGSFLENGFVVSKEDNQSVDQGDSLVFTGMALSSLSCEKIEPILHGLEQMQDHFGGYLVRFDPLPREYIESRNYISRDGATGLLYGLVRVLKRCPNQAARISSIKKKWQEAVGNSFLLHPNSTAVITPSFRTFWKVGHGIGISDLEYEEYILSTLFTAQLIQSNKSSCYPIHLETIQNLTFEEMGKPIFKRNKDQFCKITNNMGLMLTDWYCGRNIKELKSWLQDPNKSPNFYMHQRCSWEQVDGLNKLSPRVDFIVLFRHILEGS